LLAGWNFIPDFATKDFQLKPTMHTVVDGSKLNLPSSGPVVFLAHGYLGSRFDLSHLAEALAQEGM
jgi:predicted dienelactone hydrolase